MYLEEYACRGDRRRSGCALRIVAQWQASGPALWGAMAVEDARSYAELLQENARLRCELAEARQRETEGAEQQAATSEILRVIAGSPTDLQRVLDVLAENAARLCGANDALILRLEG